MNQQLLTATLLVFILMQGLHAADNADESATETRALRRQLALSLLDRAFQARDFEHDTTKAVHLFVHAGLNGYAVGDAQLGIDAGHAAQDVIGAVDFTFRHSSEVNGAAVSPDQEVLCTWSYAERSIRTWSLKTGVLLKSLTLDVGIGDAEFHPRERVILVKAVGRIALWPFDEDKVSHEFNPFDKSDSGIVPGVPIACFRGNGLETYVVGHLKSWLWTPGVGAVVPERAIAQASLAMLNDRYREGTLEAYPLVAGRLANKDDRESVGIWDWRSGKLIKSVSPKGRFLHVIANAAKREVLTWSAVKDKVVAQLWSLDQVEPLKEFDTMPAPASFALSPDGNYLVMNGKRHSGESYFGESFNDSRFSVWSWPKRETIFEGSHDGTISALKFDSSSRFFVTIGGEAGLQVWGLDDDRESARTKRPAFQRRASWRIEGGIESVSFPRSRPLEILVTSQRGRTQLLPIPEYWLGEATSSQPLHSIPDTIKKAFLTPDGKRSVSFEGSLVRVRTIQHGLPPLLFRMKNSIGDPPRILRWFGEDRFVVVNGSVSATLSLWSLKQGKALWKSPEKRRCRFISGSANGSYLLTWSSNVEPSRTANAQERGEPKSQPSQLELWSVDDAKVLQSWAIDPKEQFFDQHSGKFVDDRRFLLWSGRNLVLREVGRETPLREWTAKHFIQDVEFFADRQRFLITTRGPKFEEAEAVVLSLESEKPLLTIPTQSDFIHAQLVPDQKRLLVWHAAYGTATNKTNSAALVPLDAGQPTIPMTELAGVLQFDESGRWMLGSRFESRNAWLWSTETGKLVYQFHRRGPQQNGFDENDLMDFKIDPTGRFIISSGGAPMGSPSAVRGPAWRMKLWKLSDLPAQGEWKPALQADYSRFEAVQLRADGTYLARVGNAVELHSTEPRSAPLRRMKLVVSYASINPANGHAYAVNPSGELFEMRVKTWSREDLRRELADLERRTAQQHSPTTGLLE